MLLIKLIMFNHRQPVNNKWNNILEELVIYIHSAGIYDKKLFPMLPYKCWNQSIKTTFFLSLELPSPLLTTFHGDWLTFNVRNS